MSKILVTVILILSFSIVSAQQQDTIIYGSYRLKTDTGLRFAKGPQILLDAMPEFPGGESAYNAFIKRTLHYPLNARRNHTQETVFLSFVIEKDGHLTNVQVVQGVSNNLNREALRVIKSYPKWKPAIYKGHPVRIRYYMPVRFTLNN